MIRVVRSIDAHVGGAPVRVLVDGIPLPPARTLPLQREWMIRRADQIRRAVMLPPRGVADSCGVLLTESVTPGVDAGLLFMDAEGFPCFSGTAAIGAIAVAVDRRLIEAVDITRLSFDTPVGLLHASLQLHQAGERRRVEAVVLSSVPSFVVSPGHQVVAGTRRLRVDVAFGGLFLAIVDTEAIGIPLDASMLPELRRLAVEICASVNRSGSVVHPADLPAAGLAGVVFTGPSNHSDAHLRSVTVSSGGGVDYSASVAGTSAVMAVLDAMGLIADDQPFVHESLIGTFLRGRILRRTEVGGFAAIVPEIEATAWVTGEHTFYLDAEDPLGDGISLSRVEP